MKFAARGGRLCFFALFALAKVLQAENGAPEALRQLIETTWRCNAEAEAARYRVREAAAVRRGTEGFRDPRLMVNTGYAERDPLLPALPAGFAWLDDTAWGESGLEAAFPPGFHAGIGAALRREQENGSGTGESRASAIGAQVRIPLARDRGFALWHADRSIADEGMREAVAVFIRTLQDLRRDVELHYVDLQHAHAQSAVSRAATERAERLLSDAEQMAQLGIIPVYQLYPARLEAARRHEEEVAAERGVRTARRRLVEILGTEDCPAGTDAPVDLIEWARSAAPPTVAGREEASALLRGDVQAARAAVAAEEAHLRRSREEERSDLSLHAVAGWRDEEFDSALDADGDRREPWAVGLTWRKTLGDRAARARTDEARARLAARKEQLHGLERQASADLDVFRGDFEAARNRLDLMGEAVATARDAVTAESERFQLGEGTSRQALDAQKDLTDAVRRRNDIAAELLRAESRWRHAAGEGLLDFPDHAADDKRP